MHSRLSPPAVPATDCSANSGVLCSWFAEVWSVIALAKGEVAPHTFISECSHFSQWDLCQVLNQKNIVPLMLKKRAIIFAWLFLESDPTTNREWKVQLSQSLFLPTMTKLRSQSSEVIQGRHQSWQWPSGVSSPCLQPSGTAWKKAGTSRSQQGTTEYTAFIQHGWVWYLCVRKQKNEWKLWALSHVYHDKQTWKKKVSFHKEKLHLVT